MKSEHIGVVACSAEGAALCYRTICSEGEKILGAHGHPEISMHTQPLADYMACIDRSDWQGVAELMLSSADKVARIGAKFLICPDNTLHQAMSYVSPRTPLPWLHIADVVVNEAVRRGSTRLGLLGTRWLLDGDVYPEKLMARGLEFVRPPENTRAEINHIIMDELIRGEFKSESVAYMQGVISNMKEQGCDAVVLGCTELPLILDDSNCALATLDSTRLLARAALNRATAGD